MPPASKYQKGVRAEREVRALLEEDGEFVIRSAGSRSPVDLVSIYTLPHKKKTLIRLIQVKATSKSVGVQARAERELKLLQQALPPNLRQYAEAWVRARGGKWYLATVQAPGKSLADLTWNEAVDAMLKSTNELIAALNAKD